MPELELLQLLSAGGDMATIAVMYALWRMDRRLLTLELVAKKAVVE
ncbi:MAG: hypothetical protein ACK4OG_08170 [Parvibaculum sp.]